jgi:hypothetical protein
VRHVTRYGEMKSSYKIPVGTPAGKVPLRRLRCIWENKIKMDLGNRFVVDCIHLVQDRIRRRALVNTVTNLWLHSRRRNC